MNPAPTARAQTVLPTVLLLAVTAVWGATFVLVQDVTDEIAVFSFLFWRFGLAGVFLLLLRPTCLRLLSASDWRHGVYLGLFLSVGYGAQTIGLRFTSATVAGFITGMFVVFTPILAAIIYRRKVSGTAWLAVVLAAAGLALISLRGFSIGFGEAIVLVCAVGFAAHLVFLSEWTSTKKAYPLTIVQLLVVALVSLFLSLFDGGPTPPPSGSAWLATAFLALVATAAAYLAQSWAQAHMTSTRAAVVLTMEPVFAGVFGVLLAGDEITWRTLLGGALILCAMYLVELNPNRRIEYEPSPHP